MNPLDLVTAGVSIVNQLITLHHLDQWFKLIFGFIFTFVTTSTMAAGTALLAHASYPVALGTGLVSGSSAITALFFYSDRTRGIMIVQDKQLLANDLSNYQAVEKGK